MKLRSLVSDVSLTFLVWLIGAVIPMRAADADVIKELKGLNASLHASQSDEAKQLPRMVNNDQRARMQEASLRLSKQWQAVATKQEWEKFRDERIDTLRSSLGVWPKPPEKLEVVKAGQIDGDGYRIDKILYQSRPGLWVTANLYSPSPSAKSMPGIILSHSHHSPHTQGELQDMGVAWARRGCVVLVPEHLGHGERRQHPFVKAESYAGKFQVGRQDYWFRYNTALQLYAVGESLMGWMAWDLMRGVDVLLQQPGVDAERIMLIGGVAGGGDPAGVTAALDSRITIVAPFNFGGVQPDYSTPENTDRDFYWFGVAHWETTRNLALSARDGFAHWVIVGSVAPRKLLHCHEFAWDKDRDPAWPRLEKVFGFNEARDHLAVANGTGNLKGQPPEASHCNNVGPVHRASMYPTMTKWLGVDFSGKELTQRHSAEELACLTPEVVAKIKPRPLHEVAAEVGASRAEASRKRLADLKPEERRRALRQEWAKLLGDVEARPATVKASRKDRVGSVSVERLLLEAEAGIALPAVVLRPDGKDGRLPVVVGFAQEGKDRLLKERAEEVAALLQGGVAVALVDVRGTGETRVGDGRGRGSSATSASQTEWMLGGTLVGARLRDLRSLLGYLRTRPDMDAGRVALWGESLAAANAKDRNVEVPLDAEKFPELAEPLGGLLGLLGGLFEDDVRAMAVRGGLVSFQSLLASPFVYVPHDAVVPGAAAAGDLPQVAAAIAPRPLRLEAIVDGHNKVVAEVSVASAYGSAAIAERSETVAAWLLASFRDK